MIVPMGYLNWQHSGKYGIRVDLSGGMSISASTWLTPKIRMEVTALEVDGMSAVVRMDGKSRIYSTICWPTGIRTTSETYYPIFS